MKESMTELQARIDRLAELVTKTTMELTRQRAIVQALRNHFGAEAERVIEEALCEQR